MSKGNRRRRPKAAAGYFLYREFPFRPLYMHGVGFREPPSRLEQSLSRDGFYLWIFISRHVARAMCNANNRPGQPCSYAEMSMFSLLNSGRDPTKKVTKPTTAMNRKASTFNHTEDLS